MSNTSPANDEKIFGESTELNRRLGFTEVFSIVISRIIGSGIFRTPGPIMIAAGSVSLFYGSWIIGAIATILAAILYAELVAMIPRSGGPYTYLKAAFPPWWAFLRGWAMFFVSETAAIVAVALVFSDYTNALWQASTGSSLPQEFQVAMSLGIIWLHTGTNLFGVGFSGILQDVFSFAKIAALLVIVISSFSTGIHSENFTNQFWPQGDFMTSLVGVFAALRYAFFAYSGWEGATYVAEEVKNPRRNLPLSLFSGIGAVLILYLLVNTAYLNQLSVSEILVSGKQIAADSMQKAAGFVGIIIISAAVMMSTFGNVGTQIMVKARTWHAMARDGMFFTVLGKLNEKTKTPDNSLIAQGIWASVLLVFSSMAANSYETVIDFFSFTSAVFNISTFLVIPVLRKKYPDAWRPYRAWGYPFTLWIVVGIYVIFAVVTLYDRFIPSISGFILTLSGLFYYFYAVKPRLADDRVHR
jgi:amino acid transporter